MEEVINIIGISTDKKFIVAIINGKTVYYQAVVPSVLDDVLFVSIKKF